MTRKQRRMVVVAACALGLGSAAALTLNAFNDNLVFFVSPSDIAQKAPSGGRTFRLGGLVEAGSVTRGSTGGTPRATFRVTDGKSAVTVSYEGILPDLFREGQGIVALGHLTATGGFVASEVLAKHDETYMPKEVVDSLKRSGHWDPNGSGPTPGTGS